MPAISVIIPFYNRILWTKEAISSVLCQSFQDFEILLIDDGSTEDISCLADLLNNRSVVYIRQKNSGVAAARNRGLEMASGEYIAFLDSDDLFTPKKLEIQLAQMQVNPSIGISHTSYDRIDKNGNYIETMHSGRYFGNVYPSIYLNCPIATPTVLMRRGIVRENNLRFCEDISIAEDLLFWTQFTKNSEILGLDDPLTKVRIHGSNAAFDPKKQIIGLNNIISYGIIKDTFLPTDQRRIILSQTYETLSILYSRDQDKVNAKIFAELARKESPPGWGNSSIVKILKAFKRNNNSIIHKIKSSIFRRIRRI